MVNAICEELIEMHPNREHNYCCCAGGGVINCGPPYKMTRMDGNRIKAEQLFAAKSRGAKILIAPCHNCHSGLEDINHHYDLGYEIKFISDILYDVHGKALETTSKGSKERLGMKKSALLIFATVLGSILLIVSVHFTG